MSDKPEYCCIWCHELLTKEQTYVNHRGSTICAGCRGLGAVMLSKWKCSRSLPHSVTTPAADDREKE